MVGKRIRPGDRSARPGKAATVIFAPMANDSDLESAHRHCASHRTEVLTSAICGCFYCLAIFSPTEILDWVDEDESGVGRTALCPRCGIDAVIGSNAGVPIGQEFLDKMHAYWFERSIAITPPK